MAAQKSIMWQYIAQEPAVLTRLLETDELRRIAVELGRSLEAIYVVAHGSSYNAAVSTAEFLASTARLRVYATTPADFCCNPSSLAQERRNATLVVTISQTGTSSGTIEALEAARAWGFRTLGITDVKDSPVAKKADRALYLLCGEEDSNAKTKGYSATLTLLMLLGIELGMAHGALDESAAHRLREELRGMTAELPALTERLIAWCRSHDFGTGLKDLYVLGSGMNLGTAQEGQLKLMETVCIPTMFNDIGEFSHGMHRSITPQSSVLLIRSANDYAALTLQTYRYLKGITPHVWLLDASGQKTAEDDTCIPISFFPATQSLLLTTLAVQVLSVYAPEQQGLDPNRDAHNDLTEVVGTRVGQQANF